MLRDPATECDIENANPNANLPKLSQTDPRQALEIVSLVAWRSWEGKKKPKSNDLKLERGSCPAAAVSALPSAILSDLETFRIKQIH